MKSLARIVLIILLSFGMAEVAHAQKFLDRLKEKAQQKIEKRVEDKVDQKMDESLDKVEESISSDDGDSSSTEKAASLYAKPAERCRFIGYTCSVQHQLFVSFSDSDAH